MTDSQKIELRISAVQQRLREIAQLEGETYTEEIQTENRALQAEFGTLEERKRACLIAEGDAEQRARETVQPDAEHRERLEIRSRARLTNYFVSAARGRMVDGAEAELSAAAKVGGIPLEIFDVPRPEHRVITPAPGTVGVNLDPIRPAVFANSIAPRLGIDMPMVESGTYATATITQSQTAAAKTKGDAAVASEGTLSVDTATPKRISARLELLIEDIAAVGQENFEAILRQNTSLILSDQLDFQMTQGNGTAPNLIGMFEALDDPTGTAKAAVAVFDDFVEEFALGVEGLWAENVKQVAILAGVATYQISAQSFRDGSGGNANRGEEAFSDYAMGHYGGWWTSKRMPAPASNIQAAILYRMGRSMQGGDAGMRTAVCPHWGEISIDDVYSGSASGLRSFNLHVLVGDVILVQEDAYKQVRFRTAV